MSDIILAIYISALLGACIWGSAPFLLKAVLG